MTRQTTSSSSYDLLRHCLDLLETVQPMMQSQQASSNKIMFGLAMQTVYTITSMIQGPHEGNQKALLSTSFLGTVNRLMSSSIYVANPALAPLKAAKPRKRRRRSSQADESQHPETKSDPKNAVIDTKSEETLQPQKLVSSAVLGTDGQPSINDLRCWFRRALLQCVCSLFEAIEDLQVRRPSAVGWTAVYAPADANGAYARCFRVAHCFGCAGTSSCCRGDQRHPDCESDCEYRGTALTDGQVEAYLAPALP